MSKIIFPNLWFHLTSMQQQLMNRGDVFIGGGSVLRSLLNNNFDPTMEAVDIDLFCFDVVVFSWLQKDLLDNGFEKTDPDRGYQGVSSKWRRNGLEINLVAPSEARTTMQEVISDFDLNCSQVATDCKVLYATPAFFNAVGNKIIEPAGSVKYPDRSLKRAAKYAEFTGWAIWPLAFAKPLPVGPKLNKDDFGSWDFRPVLSG